MQNINAQQIEKYANSDGATLIIHSIFYTIQGEGPFCGFPAVFVRLAGCNLQCPACDTDYTSRRVPWPVRKIQARIEELSRFRGLVVITGGEPFRQNITQLCSDLIAARYTVQVETNGTLEPSPWLPRDVQIVVSPKTGKVHPRIAERALCFKYVMSHDSVEADGLPSKVLNHSCHPFVARPPKEFTGRIYLQPADVQDEVENGRNTQAVIKSCMDHGYVLQVQIHKQLGLE